MRRGLWIRTHLEDTVAIVASYHNSIFCGNGVGSEAGYNSDAVLGS